MASSDDIDCLSTLCQALREVLADPAGLNADAEEQVCELFSLLPQVFATDTHTGRTSQLLHACHPLHLVAQYLSTRWLCPPSVRIKSMRCIMELSTGPAVMADHTERLKALVGEQLREASAASYLVHVVLTTHSTPEATTAAEVLFVLSMAIPSFRDDIRRVDHAIRNLCSRAMQRPNAPHVQSYLAGVIRLLADHYADLLCSDGVNFVAMTFSALQAFDMMEPSKQSTALGAGSAFFGCCTTRRAAVLLMEALSEVLSAFPTAYWSALGQQQRRDNHSYAPVEDSVVRVLHGFLLDVGNQDFSVAGTSPKRGSAVHYGPQEATVEDCMEAAWSLFRIIMSIEGRTVLTEKDRSHAAPVFRALSSGDVWREVTTHAVPYPIARPRLCLLREAVACALTTATQGPLVTAMLDAMPTLCSLLVPERSNPLCMREAALILGLLLTKAPTARREMRRLVEGFEAWAHQLCARTQQLLRSTVVLQRGGGNSESPDRHGPAGGGASSCYPAQDFDIHRLLVVDVFQTILNDGDQAQHVDMLNEERVAQALLHEQHRRMINASVPSPLDTAFVDAYFAPNDDTISARARELSYRLALTLMIEATNLSLTQQGPLDEGRTDGATREGQAALASSPSLRRDLNVGTPRSVRSSGAARPASPSASARATTPSGGASASRYQEWVDQHLGGKAKQRTLGSVFGASATKTPFRPSGTRQTGSSATPSPVPHANEGKSARAGIGSRTPRGASTTTTDYRPGTSILDVVKAAPLASDEYLSMAVMMHLPIRFGPHYNRNAKAAVRKVVSPQGLYVQPIRRNASQTWSASDARVGELHVIFIPFHKLSCQRIEEEIVAVDKHLVEMSKLLVTTPNVQRTRRWFLQDMVHDILPKTELLLRDLLDLLYKFGVDDVVYQLSLIRVADEGQRHGVGVFASAVDMADTAMPSEILRLSSGAFRDILHSGNVVFAVQELRRHYFDADALPAVAAQRAAAAGGLAATQDQWNTLTEVDKEIRELEHRLDRNAAQRPGAGVDDQVSLRRDRVAGLTPGRYADAPSADRSMAAEQLMAKYQQQMHTDDWGPEGGGNDGAPHGNELATAYGDDDGLADEDF